MKQKLRFIFCLVFLLIDTPLFAQKTLQKEPFVAVSYSQPKFSVKDAPTELSSASKFELNWGIWRQRATLHSGILDYTRPSLLVGFGTENTSPDADEYQASFWRFGVAVADGYAYQWGTNSALTLYCNSGLVWTDVDATFPADAATISQTDLRVCDGLHVGTLTQAGANVQIGKVVLGANMERALIFPAYIFLQSSLSYFLQHQVHSLAGMIADYSFERSAKLAPVVYFLLKNGINFTFYELRRSNMNWPFSSEKPLFSESFNLSVSLLF